MNPRKKPLRYECIGMVGLSLMRGGERIELHDHCFGNAVDLFFSWKPCLSFRLPIIMNGFRFVMIGNRKSFSENGIKNGKCSESASVCHKCIVFPHRFVDTVNSADHGSLTTELTLLSEAEE